MAVPSPAAPIAERLSADARAVMPGGVAAAARFHPALGRPFLTAKGEGAWVTDVDGRRYIDLETSFGATLLGHGHPRIRAAIEQALDMGVLCGHDTPFQAQLARRLTELVPSAELVRFTGSGTETVWHAARIARAATGRELIVKFEGHFHGFSDSLGYSFWPSLADAGDPAHPNVRPESAGIPAAERDAIRVLPWNDIDALRAAFAAERGRIAAVVMEPVNIDSGTIHPLPGYLAAVKEIVHANGALLIFDEILTGFRTNPSGAQGELGVTPDLTALGKALGGGQALGAVVGRRDVMSNVSPLGKAVHSGTFMAHLLPIMAGIAFLDVVTEPGFYAPFLARAERFVGGVRDLLADAGLVCGVQAYGPRFSLLFGIAGTPRTWRDVAGADRATELRFYGNALAEGVYLHHGWHHGISAAHTDADLDEALGRLDRAARRTVAQAA
ncbi:MAG: aspartate aminotransferase family protein [Chloroflexota bacterium]